MPSSRASPLPDPLGTIASDASEPTSADPTSLTVPSPPHATNIVDTASTARLRQLARVPWPLGDEHLGIEPPLLDERRSLLGTKTRATSRRRPAPEIGLMMTTTFCVS